MSLPPTWHCVIQAKTYRTLYLGTDAALANEKTVAHAYHAEADTPGDAERLAAIGAGKLTQRLRAEEQ
jgi:hypothetical protein